MKVLVVGSGGREHALAWKLAQTEEVFCCPGSPGMAQVGPCFPDADPVDLCKSLGIDLVVVGPEVPLIDGLADRLRGAGFPTFGPGVDGARLEGSKSYSKDLMAQTGVPTARFGSFTDPEAARKFAATLAGGVVKASGNAQGKGVIVCDTLDEANRAIDSILSENIFGSAGAEIVVEERLTGPEFSLFTLVSGQHYQSLPIAQDYKRAFEGNTGPNTGGMGSMSPVAWVSEEMVARAERECVVPILEAFSKQGIDYRGVIFTGLLVQDGKPYCLEYNVRFGDPETQSLVLRLGPEFAAAVMACAKGLPIPKVTVSSETAVTVVVAAQGYPERPHKGDVITLRDHPGAQIFHAGTVEREGKLVTNGGRVFGVSALGSSVAEARAKAYTTAKSIQFEGAWYRSDIANS